MASITAMSRRPHWAIECLDLEEAEALLEHAPAGSGIELVEKDGGDFVILWVPVPDDVIEAERNSPYIETPPRLHDRS